MEIKSERAEDGLTVALIGRLDTTTAPELEEALSDAALEGVCTLALDLAGLEYISSAGLRVLFSAHKRMQERQGALKLIHVSEEIAETFTLTGYSEFLQVE